jgi:hypothetical protein
MSTTEAVFEAVVKPVFCGRCFDRNWDGRADDLGVLETIEDSEALAFYPRQRTSTPWLSDDGWSRSRLDGAIVTGGHTGRRSFEFRCRSGCGPIGVSASRLRRIFDAADVVRIR